jgi:hypothetical protein
VYHLAATLGRWSLDAGVFTGRIVTTDPYRLQQKPLTLVIPRAGRPFEWRLTDVAIVGEELTGHVSIPTEAE